MTNGHPKLSILIPASNERAHLGACLSALLASDDPEGRLAGAQVIVIANGCQDDTAAIARAHAMPAQARGWALEVIETARPGKLHALNLGEAAASGALRAYLDADVRVSAPLMAEIARILDRPGPAWASGRPRIAPARSPVTRAYARFWQRLPFLNCGVPGFGLFAVNASGRARWRDFPDIISDDTFVRLHFAPIERLSARASYEWPMVEGFARLLRVRRRQDAGVAQLRRLYPQLAANEDSAPPNAGTIARLMLRDPLGFAIYGAVALAVRLTRSSAQGWARGR